MVASKGNRIGNTGVYKVRDPLKLLMVLGILIAVGGVAYILDTWLFEHLNKHPRDWLMKDHQDGQNIFGLTLAANIATVLTFLRLKALWSGVALDLGAQTIQIPGGNISPNDFIDFFKPSFLFQHFMRFNIELDDIRQLSQSTRTKTKVQNGNVTRSYKYAINISGTFGAASVWFTNEGKCDEIYAAIREVNEMGEPFLKVA